ncbi:thioesterase family protein [Dactylosporangium sp. NPDC051485]|uniref:acyl-CoA thioesterase n=1 Tax=Dactylosporangium sp. NPDC051485 TaxID=3154846 RepID=UPI003445FD24
MQHVDVDDSGVMHFSRYQTLVEFTLLRGLAVIGVGLPELRSAGVDLVCTEATARYLGSARFLEDLIVTARIPRVGVYRSHIEGTVARESTGGVPIALSEVSLVVGVVSIVDRRPAPMPGPISRILTAVTSDGGSRYERHERRAGHLDRPATNPTHARLHRSEAVASAPASDDLPGPGAGL